MCAQLTADEAERNVNAGDAEIGSIETNESGNVCANPDAGTTDAIKSKLGWGDSVGERYEFAERNVETVTDDEVRVDRL